MNKHIFQIYFDNKSKQYLSPLFIPYKNESKDGFFENSVIANIYKSGLFPTDKDQYIGITSWKLTHPTENKTHLSDREIMDFIKNDIDSGTEKDVYIYSTLQGIEAHSEQDQNMHGIIKAPDIWTGHKSWGIHPYDADSLLNDSKVLPFDLFDGKWQYCYQNYWICKPHVFKEYCQTVLLPFIDFFDRPDIKQHPASVPWYKHRHEQKLYPSYCFTGEGLFGAFLAHSNYIFDYIVKSRARRKLQWIKIDGYEIVK